MDRAKPAVKAYKLADGGGFFLLIQPNGSKLWRLRYFYLGKERTLSIGAFPAVGLADRRSRTARAGEERDRRRQRPFGRKEAQTHCRGSGVPEHIRSRRGRVP